ncbi:MAG TPA: phosphoribosyltransferase [Blastocatellia bacterium]|nr:phosphoribosyltransferase [Blastocatellia bacterium]
MLRRFTNRAEAGRVLAGRLKAYAHQTDVLVLALPRGGVPVAFEVAEALDAPLDVFLVRKLGTPGHSELAMGAIASGGVRVLNPMVVEYLAIPDRVIDRVTADEQKELERRERAYRDDRPPIAALGRAIILVDDGLATGATMRAAVAALKQQHPARIVVAVPVAPVSTCEELGQEVDEVVCPLSPQQFDGVGRWYEDFSQTTDDEVRALLEQSRCQAAST